MKTYRHLYEQMIEPKTVSRCALDAAEGKFRRPEVQNFFKNFDESYDYVIKCSIDPDYNPCENNQHQIIDGANHKQREIEKPRFCPEQVLHHMLIHAFRPVLLNGLYEQVYGCLPAIPYLGLMNGKEKVLFKKFGPHAAIKRLTKWVRKNPKSYVAETDVHHAYGSVHISTLVKMMQEVIKDDKWLKLTYKFLHYIDESTSSDVYGLILGHYTSPWFFNFYLKKFDHFMASQPGIQYLRFADNMFIIGTNKRKVHQAVNKMKKYLLENLRLELNSSTQVYRFEYVDENGKIHGRAINALGAVIHYNRVTLRKSILQRMRGKSNKIHNKGLNVTWHDGASMFSRMAWVRHTDIYTYYENNIKSKINTKRLKRKVSNHSKIAQNIAQERRRIIYDGLEKSERLSAE